MSCKQNRIGIQAKYVKTKHPCMFKEFFHECWDKSDCLSCEQVLLNNTIINKKN